MTQGSKNGGKRSKAVAAKRDAILQAGLSQFAKYGIHGATLEHIAECAGVSKTNLLYYFPSKDVLYIEVLKQILSIWLAPLRAFRRDLEPLAAIGEYIRLKMEVSRDYPEASRLFCMEMLPEMCDRWWRRSLLSSLPGWRRENWRLSIPIT